MPGRTISRNASGCWKRLKLDAACFFPRAMPSFSREAQVSWKRWSCSLSNSGSSVKGIIVPRIWKDLRLRLQQLGDVGHPRAVAVVLDHREDGPRGGAPRDFLHIVAQVFTVDLHPWIEGGIL